MARSRWRNRWARLISETLAALPAGHGYTEARQALLTAYPFTREGYPYKMWLIEQRAALARYEKPKDAGRVQDRCGIRLLLREGRPWIDVVCDWCRESVRGGCFLCVRHCDRLNDLLADELCRSLRIACRSGDEVAVSALADWYRERLMACDMDLFDHKWIRKVIA